MSFHFFFIPFEKFDHEPDFLVYGVCACESLELIDAVNSKRIDSLSICEMHNHKSDYVDVGKCLSLTVVDKSIIASTAIIHNPNTILKIKHGVLTGFSLKFDSEKHYVIEIALDLPRKIYPSKMRVERPKKEQLSYEPTQTRTNRSIASPS